MNDIQMDRLVNEVFGTTPTAMPTPIRETVNYLNDHDLLGQQPIKVEVENIKRGDWIAYILDGEPDEFYQANHDGDRNLNFTGPGSEFFRLDRSMFGKTLPEYKVSELEPGTKFHAVLLGDIEADFVRGVGDRVYQLGSETFSQWSATDSDFVIDKVYESEAA